MPRHEPLAPELEAFLSELQVIAHLRCAFCGWTRYVQHTQSREVKASVHAWAEDLIRHIEEVCGVVHLREATQATMNTNPGRVQRRSCHARGVRPTGHA